MIYDFAKKRKFGNPFDTTKLDSSEKLSSFFVENYICLLHLIRQTTKLLEQI